MTQSNHTPSPWHVEAEIVDGQVKYSIDQETVDESGDIERGESLPMHSVKKYALTRLAYLRVSLPLNTAYPAA